MLNDIIFCRCSSTLWASSRKLFRSRSAMGLLPNTLRLNSTTCRLGLRLTAMMTPYWIWAWVLLTVGVTRMWRASWIVDQAAAVQARWELKLTSIRRMTCLSHQMYELGRPLAINCFICHLLLLHFSFLLLRHTHLVPQCLHLKSCADSTYSILPLILDWQNIDWSVQEILPAILHSQCPLHDIPHVILFLCSSQRNSSCLPCTGIIYLHAWWWGCHT
jgi:hypothetical protein